MLTSPQQSVFRAGLNPASGSLTGSAGLEEGKEKRGRKKTKKGEVYKFETSAFAKV